MTDAMAENSGRIERVWLKVATELRLHELDIHAGGVSYELTVRLQTSSGGEAERQGDTRGGRETSALWRR